MARNKKGLVTRSSLMAMNADERKSIVYMATNTVNGKRYIGISHLSLKRRRQNHMASAKYGTSYVSPFYNAIRLYGGENFHFTTLKTCKNFKQAALEEMRLIRELRPEYNLSNGGDGVHGVGAKHTPVTIAKMREARLRNPIRHWLGKKRPDVSRHMREYIRTHPIVGRKAIRPVLCVEDNRIFLGGAMEAALAYNVTYGTMRKVLCGAYRKVRGRNFKYTEPPK